MFLKLLFCFYIDPLGTYLRIRLVIDDVMFSEVFWKNQFFNSNTTVIKNWLIAAYPVVHESPASCLKWVSSGDQGSCSSICRFCCPTARRNGTTDPRRPITPWADNSTPWLLVDHENFITDFCKSSTVDYTEATPNTRYCDDYARDTEMLYYHTTRVALMDWLPARSWMRKVIAVLCVLIPDTLHRVVHFIYCVYKILGQSSWQFYQTLSVYV